MRKVVPRTTRLITFGSPLDKTAFLSHTQVSSARNLREALATRMQPLILDYQKFRPLGTFRWINIFCTRRYHQRPSGLLRCVGYNELRGVNPVTNVVDPEATTPLPTFSIGKNPMLHQSPYEAAWATTTVS
jgi:hypothetical protein